jgi:hypothetical protein
MANAAPLTAEQVVYNLAQMNLHRIQALRAYQGTRTYRIEYQGFPGARSAEMVVKLKHLSLAVTTGGRDCTSITLRQKLSR